MNVATPAQFLSLLFPKLLGVFYCLVVGRFSPPDAVARGLDSGKREASGHGLAGACTLDGRHVLKVPKARPCVTLVP